MPYYEVLVASKSYRGEALTYDSAEKLEPLSVVSVPLRASTVTGFISRAVGKPKFAAKDVKTVLSSSLLPAHCLELARWMADYYACSLGEALRQFAPTRPISRLGAVVPELSSASDLKLDLDAPLTVDQSKAITKISAAAGTTYLLHGDTATGKTRVYMELARETLQNGRSVILLTPEISLTTQLEKAATELDKPVFVFHSQLSAATRKKIWLKVLESSEPVVVIGARSALFAPVRNIGLIVLDEAHEPAYKQDQAPRYLTSRVASQLGKLSNSKVVLGTATPSVSDYFIGSQYDAIVTMKEPAIARKTKPTKAQIIDLKDRTKFSRSPYLSNLLIDEINEALSAKKQAMVYLNRRGSARLILCKNCGWQLLCPNCDLPLVYHGDEHSARCHTCGHKASPPTQCPSCKNPEVIYRSVGTKALAEELGRLFPQAKIKRFDSDNAAGERLNEQYENLRAGRVDIMVGTQLLAKGLDLPGLGVVGVISADSSLALPDFSSEERSFQLLYQVIGRVDRGHGTGKVIIQTYHPDSPAVKAAAGKDYQLFYKHSLAERQAFKFPPFAHLLKVTSKRVTDSGAEKAALRLKKQVREMKLSVEVIGPGPAFRARRGAHHYWQLVVKSKDRWQLVEIARAAPADYRVDLDPVNLL